MQVAVSPWGGGGPVSGSCPSLTLCQGLGEDQELMASSPGWGREGQSPRQNLCSSLSTCQCDTHHCHLLCVT